MSRPASPRRLLLADDELYVTTVLAQKLGPLFDEVVVATDGEEALALATSGATPSLVVSDYQMPLCDGFELARRLKADVRTSAVPVVLLTARGHLLSPEQLAETNVVRTIGKPFSPKAVVEAVTAVMAGGGAVKAA